MMNISLRRRLVIWYGLAITLLVFVMAFVAQQVLVFNIRDNIDESLELRAQTVISPIRSHLAVQTEESFTDLSEAVEQLTEQEFSSIPLFLRITLPDGHVVSEFGEIPDPMIPALDRQIRVAGREEAQFETIAIRGIESLRVYTTVIRNSLDNQPLAIIQTADSLSQVASAQNQLFQFTLFVGVPGSVAALLIGLWILHRGLRPLDRILRHVQTVEGDNLKARLPDEPRPPELQRIADSLNSMLERLDVSFQAKQMFVASVSHEVRTPLTALEGQLDVLLLQPALDPDIRDSLERMSREASRLVKMTNSLLLNAELDTRPVIVPEEINLRELAEEALSEIWILAKDVDLGLLEAKDVSVPGDRDLMKQMVINLLDNAIKFTPKGGRVDLSVYRDVRWGVIEVADTGPGISSYHLPNIMQAFYKADRQKAARVQGAGLGLAIVKQIVELHHADIDIRSQEGVGTTVRVRLPLSAAADDGDEPSSEAAKMTETFVKGG